MIVCQCAGTTDRDIRAAVKSGSVILESVIRETGCCTDCESCLETVQQIIDATLAETAITVPYTEPPDCRQA